MPQKPLHLVFKSTITPINTHFSCPDHSIRNCRLFSCINHGNCARLASFPYSPVVRGIGRYCSGRACPIPAFLVQHGLKSPPTSPSSPTPFTVPENLPFVVCCPRGPRVSGGLECLYGNLSHITTTRQFVLFFRYSYPSQVVLDLSPPLFAIPSAPLANTTHRSAERQSGKPPGNNRASCDRGMPCFSHIFALL